MDRNNDAAARVAFTGYEINNFFLLNINEENEREEQ